MTQTEALSVEDMLKLVHKALELDSFYGTKKQEAITAIKEALRSSPTNGEAQPAVALEQRSVSEHLEPVAWMNAYGGLVHKRITKHERNNFTIPLYTTPLQRTWVGLSVFEINDLVTNTEHGLHELVERTEKLLKEKNT